MKDKHKAKRKTFSNWIRTYFKKETAVKILISDEKLSNIDGMYNSQNNCMSAVNRQEADGNYGKTQERNF